MDDKTIRKRKQMKKMILQGSLFLLFLIAMYIIIKKADLTVDDLLRYQPENKFLAALLLLLFFAIKSMTVFFPVPLLYLAVGHVFSLPMAIFVNCCGIFVSTMIPYYWGRKKGMKDLKELLEDRVTMRKILAMQNDNVAFSVYMLRMCQLPMDLTSMFLGAQHLPFWPYMIGNLCGMAPSMIGITVIGENISDPSSPLFKQSLIFMLVMIGVSLLIFYFCMKKKYPTGFLKEVEKKEVSE